MKSLGEMGAAVRQRVAMHKATQLERLRLEDYHVMASGEYLEWVAAAAEVQSIVQAIQMRTMGQIENLVTHSLQYVFGPSYSFKIVVEEKRGKSEAVFVVLHNGIELDPLTSCGGGVVDVVSFTLRVAAIVMHPSQPRRLLVLDEPLKYLNVARRPAAAELMQSLVDRLGFQIVIVTHDPDFILGNVIEIKNG